MLGQKMNATFPVEWRLVFKSLSIYISMAIMVPVTLIMGIRFVSSGFDHAKTFEHMSLSAFLIVLLCIPPGSIALAFLISQWFRLAAITLSDGTIQGRNYWGGKSRIPLDDIISLTPFSNNGINAIVVNSKYHGRIYISDKTERLSELLAFLESYLPREEGVGEPEPTDGSKRATRSV